MDNQDRDYETTPVKTDVPAIGITLQYPLDEGVGRSLVFQTFIAADCRASELNTALDKVRLAADRQRAIVFLPTLKGQLEDRQEALKEETKTHFSLESERDLRNSAEGQQTQGRRLQRPNAQQVQEDARFSQQIASSQAKIRQIKQDIVVLERRIADSEAYKAAAE